MIKHAIAFDFVVSPLYCIIQAFNQSSWFGLVCYYYPKGKQEDQKSKSLSVLVHEHRVLAPQYLGG